MKKRKTGKDAAPATGPKAKESQSGSSKGDKSQSKSTGKSVHLEEPKFEVADSNMPQDQVKNLGNDDEEPKKKIVVRRADNDLYRFKEGDFPRLRINNIEDMLLLVVQNRHTNLLGDDISDFAIALRMFTRSLVIQKRVKDFQLGVESYQKKINVTRPQLLYPASGKETQELYKFSDKTLTGLQTSLDDITKNIRIEYLPKRRWSTLEKKRANIMIKAIEKQ
ncbi:hypothetical protein Tco_0217619 [Tanacetum coccineum]